MCNSTKISNKNVKANRWVQLLAFFFGFGSWIAITGLWIEVPLLTQELPESWTLASSLNLSIQAANIGVILYWIARRLNWCSEITATHLQLLVGTIGCLALIAGWRQTLKIGDESYSVVLLIAAFLLSIVDCTSSVTFLPFMARFPTSYLTPYLVGEGLSGFLPIVFGIAQGVRSDDECLIKYQKEHNITSNATAIEEPWFSPEVFFASLLLPLLLSWMAFVSLQFLPCSRRCQIQSSDSSQKSSAKESMLLTDKSQPKVYIVPSGQMPPKKRWNRLYTTYLVVLSFCCITTFGIMPSIQPYSSLPYGADFLHYVVISVGVAYPVGCAAMFYQIQSKVLVGTMTVIGTVIAVFIGFCATQSPSPPFIDQPLFGGWLMVTCWFGFTAILSYVKTMITIKLGDMDREEGLFYVGLATQVGSVFGAAAMFALVKYGGVFEEC